VAKDERVGVRYYYMAAEQGYAPAQYNLAFVLQEGSGVAKDEVESVRLYRLAAEQQHVSQPEAQANLGICLRLGIGVKKDERESSLCERIDNIDWRRIRETLWQSATLELVCRTARG
jgi:uncharacterized protein